LEDAFFFGYHCAERDDSSTGAQRETTSRREMSSFSGTNPNPRVPPIILSYLIIISLDSRISEAQAENETEAE
jgi:hypothetical protein